jgi:hypothetical protein
MGDTTGSTSAYIPQQVEDKREPLPRQTYLALRLKEMMVELQSLVAERQGLNAALKDRGGESSKDVRKMRERRGYLAIRINVLRAEQQSLVAEKEALPPLAK